MTLRARLLLTVLLLIVGLPAAGRAEDIRRLDDLRFWVGEGPNRAALAIDWDGARDDDAALAWGYRWDGAATGEQMLRDVVAADPGLFAKIGPIGAGLGRAVFGLGYDASGDGRLELDDGARFDAGGLAETPPADGAEALDPTDLYREGWETGYWHYGVGSSNGSVIGWESSGLGITSRTLADGDWHGFAFAVTLNYDEFPRNLHAAAAGGDFNADGRVDAADYTVWRDGLDGSFDATDYAIWAGAYGSIGPPAVVPAPSAGAVIGIGCFCFCTFRTGRDS